MFEESYLLFPDQSVADTDGKRITLISSLEAEFHAALTICHVIDNSLSSPYHPVLPKKPLSIHGSMPGASYPACLCDPYEITVL